MSISVSTHICYNRFMFEKLENSNIHFSKRYKAIAIYDHKFYDRSDLDILNGAQRKFIIQKLSSLGFKQLSGNKLSNDECNILFPKNAHIASSPLDLVKYTKRSEKDYLILTPMQLFLIYLEELAVEEQEDLLNELKDLIAKMPVNLKKIKDISKHENYYEIFLKNYNEFVNIQDEAIKSDLANKSHIGMM